MTENKSKNFLFEIYVENIPARFIISALNQAETLAADFLKANNLPFESIKTCGTYRRLVVYVEKIPQKTQERTEIFYGPPSRLLKDENGNFTKQAAGFASSFGASPDKLKTAVLEKKGEVLCFEKKINPVSAVKILSEMCVHIIKNLQFPKNMVWEESRLRFARPIRNLLAVYGSSPVVFKIAGVKSSKVTYGLSSLGSKKISVKTADSYFKSLEKAQVIVSDAERKEKIVKDLKNAGAAMKLSVDIDERLLEENAYLTEYPSCVPVKYPNEFLSLPREFISLVMKKQLKFFPCFKGRDTAPFFIGIRDGLSKGNRNVEEGFLSVFEARCRDAMFFYHNDLKTPPSLLEDKISRIVFQENLGTMSEKKERVRRNLIWLCEKTGLRSENVTKAADFAYLDLATNVVREFPELQGIMSGYYGPSWGLNEKSSLILKEFYLPAFAEDDIPSSREACLLSLAARMDTLAGDFALGLIPTGSQDPHGLRRAAYGAVRIIAQTGLDINLKEAFSFSVSCLPFKTQKSQEELWAQMGDFFWQRFENFSAEKFPSRELDAVKEIFLKDGSIVKAGMRAEAIKELRGSADFLTVAALYKRLKNILKSRKDFAEIHPELFEKEQERKLYETLNQLKEKVSSFCAEGNFSQALKSTEILKNPLEEFFKEVMVMCENQPIRENRLSLLSFAHRLFEELADISKLTQ